MRPRSRCSDRVLRFVLPTVLVAFALVLPGCGGEASGAPPPPVEEVARQITRGGAKSAIVFISDDGREYAATAGNRRPGKDQRFRVGSVTKTFTATIVLQLVAEGKLRLSDPLERHLPGIVPAGKKITIRQLLNHRSGLANFTDDPQWWQRAEPIALDPTHRHACASQPRSHSSSRPAANGGIRTPTTSPSASSSRRPPERRTGTSSSGASSTRSHSRARSCPEHGGCGTSTTKEIIPTSPGPPGRSSRSTHDLARFFSALLSGRLLSEGSLAQMKQTVVVDHEVGDGLGIFSSQLPCGRFWGHDGEILDYGTGVAASDNGNRVLVISARGDAGSPPNTTALLCPTDTTDSP